MMSVGACVCLFVRATNIQLPVLSAMHYMLVITLACYDHD